MKELSWVFIGIGSALFVLGILYLGYLLINMYIHRNRIRSILVQIRGQVDIKHDLLREYIEINRDSIEEEKYDDLSTKLNMYKSSNLVEVNVLKDFNDYWNYYMKSFDDHLLSSQCDEGEVKINHIKDYYNELVCFFNNYKSNKVNSLLSKAMSIRDEKLY